MATNQFPPDDNGGFTPPSTGNTPPPPPPPTGNPTVYMPKIRLPHPIAPAAPAPKPSTPRIRPSTPPKKTPSTGDLPGTGGDTGGNGGTSGIVPDPPRPNPYANRTVTVRGFGNAKLPVLWGPLETGGIICYEKLLSDGRLLVLYEICWGQIDAFTEITCGGVNLLTSGVASVVNQYLGTSSQAVDITMTAYESRWTSRLPGKAYLVVLYVAPNESNPPINHEQLKVRGRGHLERDPRLDATLVNRYYTVNPALIWAGIKTGKPFGERRPDSTIDWTAVTATANDCDFVRSDGSPRYTMAFRIDQAKLNTDVIDEMRGHAMLSETYNAGRHQIWMDKTQTDSGILFDDTNTIDCKMRVKGINECPTRVRVNFINVANGFKPDFAEYEDPGVQLGTVRLVEKTYDYYGVMSYDHAYRLCIQFYNRGKQDKELLLTVGPEGAQVLPGIVISVTSSQQNISNRKCIVTNCTPIGSRWSISTETYDATTYDDTPRTTSSYTPPANGTPYDPIPAPPAVTWTLEGPDVRIDFNWISTYRWYKSQRVTVQRAGFSETLLGEATRGPLYIRNAVMNTSYTVRTQILGIVAGIVSAIVATVFTPTLAQVPDPVNVTRSSVGTDFFIYWDPAVTLTQTHYGASNWGVTNGGAVDTSKINDGVTNVAAYNANVAADTTATFDAGVGVTKNMRGIDVFTSASSQPWGGGNGLGAADYSDNGSAWTPVTNFRMTSQSIAGPISAAFIHLGWDDAGAHRFWRYRKNFSTAVVVDVYELQWFEATTPTNPPDHYDVYDTNGNPVATFSTAAIPTATNKLKLPPPCVVIVKNNDGTGSAGAGAIVRAGLGSASSTGVSIGTPFIFWAAGSTGLVLSNGLNSNIAIGTLANQNTLNTLIDISGPTNTFSIGGFDSVYHSKTLTVVNRTGQTMTIVNEDASSAAANRVATPTGGNVALASPGVASFVYDGAVSRWEFMTGSNPTVLRAWSNNAFGIQLSKGDGSAASVMGMDSANTLIIKGEGGGVKIRNAANNADIFVIGENGIGRFVTAGAAPTAAVQGVGWGTGPTVTVQTGSSDLAGTITVTAGAAPGNVVAVKVTLSAAVGSNEPTVIILPRNGTGVWDNRIVPLLTGCSTTDFTVQFDNNGVNLAAGSTYKFKYIVIGN